MRMNFFYLFLPYFGGERIFASCLDVVENLRFELKNKRRSITAEIREKTIKEVHSHAKMLSKEKTP